LSFAQADLHCNWLNFRVSGHDPSLFLNRIDFWKIDDVATYTGYSKRTLYNLTSRDLIPHRKKRGKLYFVPFEIQNWIEEGDLK
ncbi:MAG: helix-turn-helix domain-containing protein, partial [Bdellovibrionaceae bacterium]|nr:helix-turn-helix domain-containing protein [Pseudobdellovibrionaceae bacterium]